MKELYVKARTKGGAEEWLYVGDITSYIGGTSQLIVITPKVVIPFTSTQTPSITGYQATYATVHGENPRVVLMRLDENGNYVEQKEQALFSLVNGLLDSISWDFPDLITGKIILQ
jgi:hypothetical protein